MFELGRLLAWVNINVWVTQGGKFASRLVWTQLKTFKVYKAPGRPAGKSKCVNTKTQWTLVKHQQIQTLILYPTVIFVSSPVQPSNQTLSFTLVNLRPWFWHVFYFAWSLNVAASSQPRLSGVRSSLTPYDVTASSLLFRCSHFYSLQE